MRDGDRVLLLRRTKPPNDGLYNAPGGKIEPHEDPYESCLREVHEETGIRLPGASLRGILTVVVQETGGQWVLFVFVADRPTGPADPVATNEGDLRWVSLAELSTLPVVSDIPLMLPHILAPQGGLLMGKVRALNDDADSIVDYEFRTA
ncbi:MAG TPA: 8-oxo-dGTP diphosphatase [bacterium]|nr:8-oxo-dGTP diphosphatase [bacterium]